MQIPDAGTCPVCGSLWLHRHEQCPGKEIIYVVSTCINGPHNVQLEAFKESEMNLPDRLRTLNNAPAEPIQS